MTAAPRPNWLFRVALACAAMVCVLLASASRADRRVPPVQQSAQSMGTSQVVTELAERVLAVNHAAPSDRASARPATTKRPAWQRSSGRRTQRSASSQISGVERPEGIVGGSAYDRRRGLSAVSRLAVFHRDGRLGSAPTRAPPNHR